MSSNKSIAVWCEPRAGHSGIELEVHFNYWRVASPDRRRWPTSGTSDFVEIGFMIEDVRSVKNLHFFVAMPLQSDAIRDCSPRFKSRHILQGIFNQRLNATGTPAGGPLVLQGTSGIFCRMHQFSLVAGSERIDPSEIKIEDACGGVVITIGPAALRACEVSGPSRAYYRLRLVMPRDTQGNPFIEVVPVYAPFLLSVYEQTEYLDFRLNEARTLPDDIENRMASEQPPGAAAITLVAFLAAVPVSAEVSVASAVFHKMRLLEHGIWSDYAPGIPPGMVVYHWKRDEPAPPGIQDFAAFVKLQMRRTGWKVMARYLAFLLGFALIGNLAAGLIQPHLGKVATILGVALFVVGTLFARGADWPC